MPLQGAIQSIPFVKGPDTKSDPKLSDAPAVLTNAVFRDGTVSKRSGRARLPGYIDQGIVLSVTSAGALFTLNGNLYRINEAPAVLAAVGSTLGLVDSQDDWVQLQGGTHYSQLTERPLVNTQGDVGPYDVGFACGVGVLAYQLVGSGLRVCVFDQATGVFYQAGTSKPIASPVALSLPRCISTATGVLIVAADIASGNLWSAVVDTSTAGGLLTPPVFLTVRTDVYTSAKTFDAFLYSQAMAVVAYPTTDTDIRLVALDPLTGAVLATPSPTAVTAASANGLQSGVLAQRSATGNIFVVVGDENVDSTRWFVRDATFALVKAVANLVTSGNWNGGLADFFHGAAISDSSDVAIVLSAGQDTGQNLGAFLGYAVLSPVGTPVSFTTLAATGSLSIAGDLVAVNGAYLLGVVQQDSGAHTTPTTPGLQCTACVVALTSLSGPEAHVAAKGLPYDAVQQNVTAPRVARSFASGRTGRFYFQDQGRLAYQSTDTKVTEVTPVGITELSVLASGAQPLPVIQVGGSIYIGGAYPRVFDGRVTGETGFTLYPTVFSIVDGGAGNLSAGTYQWRFCYSWTLANGELIRGPVSPPSTLTLAASHNADIEITTMSLAQRDLIAVGGNTQIEVYRTTANGTVFYRQSAAASGPQNVTTPAAAIAFTDDTSDADLIAGEFLYTTGGVLDWEAPPAYSAAFAVKQRLVILGLEDPYSWMPSSEWSPGETVRFSSLTTNYVPSGTGPLVGGASLDGKLVLFTTGAAYVTLGDGPDLFGNNNYPPVERVTSVDAGPVAGSAKAIIETPLGILFQGPNGITLLDRSLNVQYIGADVGMYCTGLWVVRSAVLDIDNQEVRFQADTGRDVPGAQAGTLVPSLGGVCLVYNYYYKQWSVFQNYGAQSACLYQGKYTMVRSDGVVFQEQPGTFRDDGVYYSSTIETPWLKMAGLQGFQRLWYCAVLGTYGSDFTFSWEVAYDYAGTAPSIPTWTEAVTLDGAGQFNPGGPFQVRHHIGHKCQAIKFRFTDTNLRGSGEGMGLTDLTLEYAGKKGAYRLPAARTL